MHLSLATRVLWAAGFTEQAALLFVLLFRGRFRSFPLFTIWIGFLVLKTVVLFSVMGSLRDYYYTYWTGEIIDLLLQIGVIFEICRNVLRPTGTWVRSALRSFLLFGAAGIVLAAGLAWLAHPAQSSFLGTWIERGRLFSSLVTLELFVAMGFSSTRLGLVWRNHVMAIATGWALWAAIDFAEELASAYHGPDYHGIVLDQIRIFTTQAVTVYWFAMFWLNEPAERKLSPAMQIYLSNMQRRLETDAEILSNLRKP